jgi:ribosomal protein S18 acetylase RimI-like enzyme
VVKSASIDVRFEVNPKLLPRSDQVLALLAGGISFANWTGERMDRALKHSPVIVCAWHGEELVGFTRAISDFAWCAYLSQLCVAPSHQRRGIGKQLAGLVLETLGDEVALIAHSAEGAVGFYQATGFEARSDVFRMKRKR